jgi:hypothetical protein
MRCACLSFLTFEPVDQFSRNFPCMPPRTFQYPTICNDNMADARTCELGAMLASVNEIIYDNRSSKNVTPL